MFMRPCLVACALLAVCAGLGGCDSSPLTERAVGSRPDVAGPGEGGGGRADAARSDAAGDGDRRTDGGGPADAASEDGGREDGAAVDASGGADGSASRADCGACAQCGDGRCEAPEDCASCPADCGACGPGCGDGRCEAPEGCASCPADCGACPPADGCTDVQRANCNGVGCDCRDGVCRGGFCGECGDGGCAGSEDCTSCPADCGACPPPPCGGPCPAGQRCLDGPGGTFCTACDPDVCGAFGVHCCPHNAPDGGCTNTFIEANHCGACGVVCGPDQLCVGGVCGEIDPLFKCPFDPMQWWRSPQERDQRDVTFVAFGDPHGTDWSDGCRVGRDRAEDALRLQRDAINSTTPSVFWPGHLWPGGAGFFREGQPFDHVRGVLIAGDLTESGDMSIPAGAQVCRQYRPYRDAFGRCGSEGRLLFPVYDGYGNHDFPRFAGAGDASRHPVVDALDRITAAHRPGAAADLYDDPDGGTGHYAWRWDDIWFVQLNLKPGWHDDVIPGDEGTRIADPHAARGFLQGFLASRNNSARRQIVIVSHYYMNIGVDSGRMQLEEKESFCRLIHNAQHGTGSFDGQKLSRSYPVAAFVHGHNHDAPTHHDWTCRRPYDDITIPHFSVGTPLYLSEKNAGWLHFTIFRIGTNRLEVVGVGADPDDPTGPWDYVFTRRLNIMNAP